MQTYEAIKLLKKAEECAFKANVQDKMFLSFGTMLGAIRPSKQKDRCYKLGIIPHDSDMDIGFLPMTAQEKDLFYGACYNEGLIPWQYPVARQARLKPKKELVWFKIGNDNAKSCVWFFYEWNGYMWHSKGHKWLFRQKFDPTKFPRNNNAIAMMLGAPARYFRELIEIDFEGQKFKVPICAGSLCDFWYPGWHEERKGGSSSKEIVGVIYDWLDKDSWRVV